MSAHHPGIRFSIRPENDRWLWRALSRDVVLAEGSAPTRAAAAAFVIREICRACAAEAAVQVPTFREAA